MGHKSNECPKRDNSVNLVEAEEADPEENFASVEDQEQQPEAENELAEEGIEGDTLGEALVIWRSLLSPPASSSNWLRKNIF